MNRAVGLIMVTVLLALAAVGYYRPDFFPGNLDLPRLVWLLMALLLVSGAGWGFWRFRADGGRALTGIAIWGAAIVVIALAYALFN